MSTLKARRIYSDNQQTVIVVASIDIRHDKHDAMYGLVAWSEPRAVVVLEESGARAIGLNTEPVDLDRLTDDTEGLSALLGR